jgi:hypothetical protein
MRSEITIASIAGISIGLIIAFGAWRLNSSIKPTENSNALVQVDNSKTNNPPKSNSDNMTISLANLEDGQVLLNPAYEVLGITSPDSTVIISGENEDLIVKADNKGEFNAEIKLTSGINQLVFRAFNITKETQDYKISVVYSKHFADDLK